MGLAAKPRDSKQEHEHRRATIHEERKCDIGTNPMPEHNPLDGEAPVTVTRHTEWSSETMKSRSHAKKEEDAPGKKDSGTQTELSTKSKFIQSDPLMGVDKSERRVEKHLKQLKIEMMKIEAEGKRSEVWIKAIDKSKSTKMQSHVRR